MNVSSFLRSNWFGRSERRRDLKDTEQSARNDRSRVVLRSAAHLAIEMLEQRRLLSTSTWTGLGSDNNWATAANWSGNVAPNPGDSLVFSGSTQTTANDNYPAGTSFNSIEFSASGFTLTGNPVALTAGITVDSGASTASVSLPVALSGSQAVTVAFGANLGISGAVSGSGALTKAGPGTVTLTGSNTYSGGTSLNAGTLDIHADSALGAVPASASTNVTFTGSATLQAGSPSVSLSANRGIAIGNGLTATLDTQGNTFTINGSITNSTSTGILAKGGTSGTLVLAGSDSFVSGTTINTGGSTNVGAGIIELTNSAALGSNPITIDGHNVTNNAVMTLQLGGGITIGSNVTYLVGGHQPGYNVDLESLSGSNTFNGTLKINNTGGNYAISSDQSGTTFTLGGSITDAISNTNRGLIFEGAGNGAINGVISDGSGSIATTFSGIAGTTWNVNSEQTYSGTTTINGGTVSLNSPQPIYGTLYGTPGGGSIVVNSGGTLLTNAINTLEGYDNSNTSVTVNTGGTLANGPGTNHITNLTLAGGTVSGSIYPTNYGGFDVQSNYNVNVTANSTISALGFVFEPNAGFNINTNVILTLSGSIIDPTVHSGVQLTTTGGGTLLVTGNNTNTGPIQINGGHLHVGNGGSAGVLGSGTVILASGAAFNIDLAGNPSIANPITLEGTTSLSMTGSGTANLTGIIAGSGPLQIAGGTIGISGSNIYKGGTVVNSGILLVENTTGSATGTGTVTVNSGGALGGAGIISGAVTVNSGGVLSPGQSGSVGLLSTGALTLLSGSHLDIVVNNSAAGTVYDSVDSSGMINVSGSTLVASGSVTNNSTDQLLILNSGVGPVVGTFSGIAEGSAVTVNGVSFYATYQTTNSFSLINATTTPSVALTGPGLVNKTAWIDLNSSHDLGNVDANGNPVQDNQPDYSTGNPVYRIRVGSGPFDPDLSPLTISLTGPGAGSYKLSFPSDPSDPQLFVWNISNPLAPVLIQSGQSYAVSVPATGLQIPLMVEGMNLSYTNLDTVTATYTPHSGGAALTDYADYRVVGVAIYVDADNTLGFGIPGASNVDGALKQDPSATGKIITATSGETNADGLPVYLDGYDLPGVSNEPAQANDRFVPVVVQMFQPVNFQTATITFNYSGSDPMGATASAPAPGYMRLWLKDGTQQRNGTDVSAGGDYIEPGVSYLASQLGFTGNLTDGGEQVTFYIEGIRPVDASDDADREITMTVDPAPGADGDAPDIKPSRFDVTIVAPQPTGSIDLSEAVSGSSVDLSWTYNQDDQTGFLLERALDSQFQTGLVSIPVADAQARSFVDAPDLGATYYYQIAPVNAGSTGTYSNIVSAVLPAGTPPVTFSNDGPSLVGSPVHFSFSGAPAGSTFSYDFYDDGLFTDPGDAADSTANTLPFTFTQPGTYTVHGQMTDSSNNSTNYFSTVVITDNSPPNAPSGLTATAESPSEIDLSWTGSTDETGYVVLQSSSYYGPYTEIGTTGAGVTTYPDRNLSDSTSYYYEVYATNSVGNSGNAGPAYAVTPLAPPTDLTATYVSPTQINLAWTDVSANAVTYYVYFSNDGTNWSFYTETGPSTDNSTYTGSFPQNSTLYFEVRGYGSAGLSTPSNVADVQTGSPTIAVAAAANPSPVTGTTTSLSVLGTLPDGTDSALIYTWTAASAPSGGTVSFTTNGTNASKKTIATFNEAGNYSFSVDVAFGSENIYSTVDVTVQQTVTSITVIPGGTTLLPGATQQFAASAFDQFGNSMTTAPGFTWSVSDDSLGSIDANGLFTSGTNYGPETIEASVGTITGSNSVTVSPINVSAPLTAVAVDCYDIQAFWLDLLDLSQGQTLIYSEDSTFESGVTSVAVPAHTTNYLASGLSPDTQYYFELLDSGNNIVGSASSTTPSLPSDGSSPPTAPVLTQEATATQISPTSESLSMAAQCGGDQISYYWQLISASSGPDPSFANVDENADTATVNLASAGTYVFLGTATDLESGTSAASVVTFTVDQQATAISVSPPLPVVNQGGMLQFEANELDQFGTSMNTQPTFAWSVSDSTLGAIDDNGNFTASLANQGSTNIVATTSGITGMATVIVSRQSDVYIGNDGLIYVQATNSPSDTTVNAVKVFTASGSLVQTLPPSGPFPPGMTFRSAQPIYLADGSYLYASNANKDIELQKANGTIVHYTIPSSEQDMPWTGLALDPDGVSFWACDESCYVFHFTFAGAKEADFYASNDLGGLGVVPYPMVNLTAYRTDGDFGQPVSVNVQNGDNPNDYAILTDIDVIDPVSGNELTTGYTTAPITNDQVVPVNASSAPDHNLAEISLDLLPLSLNQGTLQISLSDPGAVRLFTSNGVEFYDQTATGSAPLTVNFADPSGYLAGLVNGKVDLWLEGLNADPNFVMTVSYMSSGETTQTDSIHIDIISLSYVNMSGNTITGVSSEPEEDLLSAAGDENEDESLTQDFDSNLNNDEFQIAFQGLTVSNVQSLTESGTTVTLQSGSSSPETPIELVDSEDELNQSDDGAIKQLVGATVIRDAAPIVLQTVLDVLTAVVPNNQAQANDDFFFDGTNNVATDLTNVQEMFLEDSNQAPQTQAHYLEGTKDLIGGSTCIKIAQSAFRTLQADVLNDPNRTIDVVGFSRGAAESVEFANLIANALSQKKLMTNGPDGSKIAVTSTQLNIRFLGLFDLVTSIGGVGQSGNLTETLPAGVGLVAHAVALSEERTNFEFTNMSQLNPNNDALDQLGFRGAHSDIGGNSQGVNAQGQEIADPLTAVTLEWMNSEATKAGWTTLNVQKETINQPIAGLTAAQYNAYPVHPVYSYSTTVLGQPITISYPLQYRNFEVIDPSLQCWQPGIAAINQMPLFNSATSQVMNPYQDFWDLNYSKVLVPGFANGKVTKQTANGAT
jgi:autotransporter-associated beta strand protein